ncbi:MAG TPA: hypothetical protein VGI45_25280 [Terracidiphilus sp.]|jgi:hypothetical protein
MVAIALVSLVCCTAVGLAGCGNNPLGNQDLWGGIPSRGAVIGTAFGLGGGVAALAIAAHHSHHTIKGCVLSGPEGLEVQENSNSTFGLTGLTTDVKVGDRYRLHGSKLKKAKHAPGNRTFLVEKVGKDFGPCSLKPHSLAMSASFR